MAPSTTFKDRIKQFEVSDDVRSSESPNRAPRPSHLPARGYQAAFASAVASNCFNDPMGEPISPTAASYTIIKPTVPYVPRKPRIKSPSPSPPNLGCKTSLIDLKDWVVEDGPSTKMSSSQATVNGNGFSKSVFAPPLPPRKVSQNSVASGSTSSRSRSPHNASPPMISRESSNSLTVEHTYPPLAKMSSQSNMRQGQGHIHASSISSFHSVSLSSDGDAATESSGTGGGSSVSNFIATYPMDKVEAAAQIELDRDRDSVDDSFSFETVSSTGLSSPTSSSIHDWEKDFVTHSAKVEPPRLPSRRTPLTKSPALSSSSFQLPPSLSSQRPSQPSSPSSLSSATRRVPPPPPSRFSKPPPSASSRASLMSTATSASDRSSIFSTTTVTTAHTSIGSYTQLLRPTPVPLVARKRYEAVFFANVNAQRRAMMNKLSPSAAPGGFSPTPPSPSSPTTPRKGWRGLSVDLITNPENNPLFSPVSEEEGEGSRLEGQAVKGIWSKSKLLPEKLKDIWNVCALPGQTSLDKDGFVKGMWRIDEELRRIQSTRSTSHIRPPRRTIDLLH
ncbi:hypothetical protein DFH11DRAFT_1573743 [Phellopilus nigrolimitatus]|nr:hypothetical protein DFH11DRAFT_1573743 [Phellopilus nigrolimitatus]